MTRSSNVTRECMTLSSNVAPKCMTLSSTIKMVGNTVEQFCLENASKKNSDFDTVVLQACTTTSIYSVSRRGKS